MSYQIKITKFTPRTYTKKDWCIIGQEPTTEEDKRGSWCDKDFPKLKNLYGEGPVLNLTSIDSEEILIQTVAELNIENVIKAINNI